jgi:hypothetical protein
MGVDQLRSPPNSRALANLPNLEVRCNVRVRYMGAGLMSQYAAFRSGGPFPAQESMLQHARALFRAEEAKGLQSLVASKIEDIRHFDVASMERAVAICTCGRSGSMLLASYLDGHDDVIMLPNDRSTRIYEFFERYQPLSLHDKLIAYPVLTDFFRGDFPIAAADYYAAVNALFDVYRNWSLEFLESRRAFFQFLHVVYCVALGRRPASPHPLIVCAQHWVSADASPREYSGWDHQMARRFVEDFPKARFIHTVRDPIANCGRLFDNWRYAGLVIRHLTNSDTPNPGMESRTRTIRFEDLHLHLEKTIRAIADWLGLAYQSSLLDSTFNGVPWVVKRDTDSWSGSRPEQAIRDSRNISFTDQGVLFAVFNENFVAWDYPCPNIFKHALVRALTFLLVLLIPMKIEIIAAYRLIKVLPSLRRGRFRYGIKVLVRIFIYRVTIISLLTVDLCRRLVFGKKVLEMQ